jgi:hypothetical protein
MGAHVITTVEDVCRQTGDDPRALVEFFADAEKARLVVNKSALQRNETAPPMERLPLRDADGYEFGRVVASIPEDLFYHLMNRADLDPHWTETPDGVREVVKEVLKSNPACRVKTVSGKTVVGWEPKAESRKQKAEIGSPRAVGDRELLHRGTAESRKQKLNLSGANFNGMEPVK